MKKVITAASLVVFLLTTGQAFANNARDYLPLDPGMFFFAVYYNHSFGNEYYSKGSKKSNSMNFTGNVRVLRPVYYTQVGPFTIAPPVLLPVGELALSGNQSSDTPCPAWPQPEARQGMAALRRHGVRDEASAGILQAAIPWGVLPAPARSWHSAPVGGLRALAAPSPPHERQGPDKAGPNPLPITITHALRDTF